MKYRTRIYRDHILIDEHNSDTLSHAIEFSNGYKKGDKVEIDCGYTDTCGNLEVEESMEFDLFNFDEVLYAVERRK